MNVTTIEKTVASNGNMARLVAVNGDYQLSHYFVEVRINRELKMVGRHEPNEYEIAKASYDWRAEAIMRYAAQSA